MEIIRLRGLGVSAGIAMGEASLSERVFFTSRREAIGERQVEEELKRLKRALDRTRQELTELKEQVRERIGDEQAFIFDAHL